MNAKQELIKHIGDREVTYVHIKKAEDCWEETFVTTWVYLLSGTLPEVLPLLDFEYYDGYGSQTISGNIWYADGSWSDRKEYEGAEWWVHRTCPPIPTQTNGRAAMGSGFRPKGEATMNAKQELIKHIGDREVTYVHIKKAEDCWDGTFVTISGTLPEVLPLLDFEYYDGYGSQTLFGNIWYADGSWSDREEYDGAEWWVHRTCPPIPTQTKGE